MSAHGIGSGLSGEMFGTAAMGRDAKPEHLTAEARRLAGCGDAATPGRGEKSLR